MLSLLTSMDLLYHGTQNKDFEESYWSLLSMQFQKMGTVVFILQKTTQNTEVL